jgi:hypothetical protein
MSELWLNLPMPPSLNNAYPTSKSGRRFKSPRYQALARAGRRNDARKEAAEQKALTTVRLIMETGWRA